MENFSKTASILINNVFKTDSPLHLPYEKADFFPRKDIIINAFKTLKNIMFVHTAKSSGTSFADEEKLFAGKLKNVSDNLKREIKNTFCIFCKDPQDCALCQDKAATITAEFIDYLPKIQDLALSDISAAYNGDPAAKDNYEVLLCYPGLTAVTYQRMAHFFYLKDISLIPRIVTEYAHSRTGIDIHPGASIGKNFFIDHGTGVVIGETATIGNNVKIYQGVTLGAKSFPLDEYGNPQKGIKRHPDVGNDVTIYAGATILGPVKIGSGSTIAANTWITQDVETGSFCKKQDFQKDQICLVKRTDEK